MARWSSPVIVDDPRIRHDSAVVRAAAEALHNNESMHLHVDVPDKVCVYCALRATRALDAAAELQG